MKTLIARVYSGDTLELLYHTGEKLIIKFSSDKSHITVVEETGLFKSLFKDL